MLAAALRRYGGIYTHVNLMDMSLPDRVPLFMRG